MIDANTHMEDTTMVLTPEIAIAAGKDAANARMRKAGRKCWNRADFNYAVKVQNRLLQHCGSPYSEIFEQRRGAVRSCN